MPVFFNTVGSACLCDPSLKLRCLMISLWSYATAHRAKRCARKPWGGQMESWGKLHNCDQRLSSWQMRRQCYNYSSSELFLFVHLPFIFAPCKRRPYGTSFMCVCLLGFAGLCACVCAHTRGSKYSSENPIKGDMYWFAVLFKAFWDISTDISFNVRANGRKQTNLLLPSFLPLFPLFYLFSSLSVTLHQSLSYTAPCLQFFPLLIAMLLQDATLS